ncbi:hypothetical protein BaRGS_00000696 [Batillaria attramentaria]|uniref:AN1-type zinc finger protein 4 n=1 Tax=Batillaria attramentaria TaxID=370345 RepID=A0ABD0M8F3_9CAEN
MELFIETLTGTAFELRVSPFETVMSVKAKIQRLEGIPISHQHLIWQSVELEDDYCLHDYQIHSGATLKLVLAMRGGPINTRRIPMEDTALREMAEYMEANKDEILDKLPDSRNVTLLVFREGDQLNFFRVVDRGDGTLTPLSESHSTSVFNLEEEEEELPTKEKVEENDKMKEKLDQLRVNMEKMSLTRKKRPKPPTSGRGSHSGTRSGTRMRLRQLSSSGRPFSRTLNKNACLPPVGHTFPTSATSTSAVTISPSAGAAAPSTSHTFAAEKLAETAAVATIPAGCRGEPTSAASLLSVATPVLSSPSTEDLRGDDMPKISSAAASGAEAVDPKPSSSVSVPKKDSNTAVASGSSETLLASGDKAEAGILETLGEVLKRSPLSARKEMTVGSGFSRPTTSARFHGLDRRKEFALESLSTGEARTMSGILRQASIEKLGSSHIGSIVSSASKSRLGSYCIQEARIPTPESRLVSARLQRVSANRDGRLMSPSHRLPPVKAKKKATKRCYVCGKKTGLATSYQCRCGNNFCATHRYAESHDCTFDYKTEGRKLLEQSNPVVSAPKLPKI